MIPSSIDCKQLILSLNQMGWKDYKIALATGLDREYIYKVKKGVIRKSGYEHTSKLYNFYVGIASTSHHVIAPVAA